MRVKIHIVLYQSPRNISRVAIDRVNLLYTVQCQSAVLPRVRKMAVTVAGPRLRTHPKAICDHVRPVGAVKTGQSRWQEHLMPIPRKEQPCRPPAKVCDGFHHIRRVVGMPFITGITSRKMAKLD